MKKKIIALISLALLLIAILLGCIFWDPIIDWLPIDQSGWDVLDNGGRCYLDEDGDPLTGWQELDSNIYYFDPETYAMQIRWLELEDGRYYLGNDGVRQTGWQEILGVRYYLGEDGAMHTGWLQQDAGMMYLNEHGNPHYGWLKLADHTYYLDESGIMHTGWLELNGNVYYMGISGAMNIGWLELEDGKYYFGEDGILLTGWQEIDGNFYYLGETGVMKTGWLEMDGNRYYLCADGTRYTGWLEMDGQKYYFKEDGTAAKGRLDIDGKTYFFTSTGANIIMVNAWFAVPDDYNPDLIELPGMTLDSSCSDALTKMLDDCKAAGCSPKMAGSYRSVYAQQMLINNIIQEYRDEGCSYDYAKLLAMQRCAKPGYSEHHLGLAFDITDHRYPQKYTGENNAVVWLSENAWKYGFILRYPEDKTHITGIMGEPWHFRYVGTELALEMKDSGLCLEEYLDNLTNDGTTCGNPAALKTKKAA